MSYGETVQLKNEIMEKYYQNKKDALSSEKNREAKIYTRQIQRKFLDEVHTVEDLKQFFEENSGVFGKIHEAAYDEFMRMLKLLQNPETDFEAYWMQYLKENTGYSEEERQKEVERIKQDLKKKSVEEIIEEYLRMYVPKNTSRKKTGEGKRNYTYLQRVIKKNWPSESIISKMKTKEMDVDKSAAEYKATNYMDNYETRIQLLSEDKKEVEEKNSEEDLKAQKNIFETDEFSFEIPDSWVNGYYSGTGGEFGISYLYFCDKNISYKSDGALMHLILTRDKEFEKEEGFEYTRLEGKTVFGRSIYMAVNIKQPDMDPEDKNFEQEYLKKRSECEEIPKTLKLKTSFEGRKIENAKYSFYLPKSWERNVIVIFQKDKDYMSYSFYQKKSFFPGGDGFTLGNCFNRLGIQTWYS